LAPILLLFRAGENEFNHEEENLSVVNDDQDQHELTHENPRKNSGMGKKENKSGKSNSELMAEFYSTSQVKTENKIGEKS